MVQLGQWSLECTSPGLQYLWLGMVPCTVSCLVDEHLDLINSHQYASLDVSGEQTFWTKLEHINTSPYLFISQLALGLNLHRDSKIWRTGGLTLTPWNFHSRAQKSADSIISFLCSAMFFVSSVLDEKINADQLIKC